MDIIFFALVAGFIAYKYYSILGRKDDATDDLENRIKTQEPKEFMFYDFNSGEPEQAAEMATKVIEPITTSNNEQIIEVMNKINSKFPTFNEKFLLNGAKNLFEMLLTAFSANDLSNVKQYIGESLQTKINNEINYNVINNNKVSIDLVGFNEVSIISAHTHNNMAVISIRFVTEQMISINKPSESNKPKLERIDETWVFEKNLDDKVLNFTLKEII